jgi:hypothetical protein
MSNGALTGLVIAAVLPVAACGKSEPAKQKAESGGELRKHFERVLAAVPAADAPEQKCPDAEIAKTANGLAKDVVLLHIDRLRELAGADAKPATGSDDELARTMRQNISNTLLEGLGPSSGEVARLLEDRPWLLVTQSLDMSAAAAVETAGKHELLSGRGSVRISLHERATGRALCWTTAQSSSSDRVVTTAGNENESAKGDLAANIISSIAPALARITTALEVRKPPST